jgi:GNAT superfamily N-acetyltransferase
MSTDIKTIPASDLDAVVALQQQSYPQELWEDAAIFREKQRVFPKGALGWYQDGVLQAYLFVHPWRKNETAPLFTENMSLPENPDCLYIHDLAIAPAARGKGAARALVTAAFALAEENGLEHFSLVAVQNSESFWSKFGFTAYKSLTYSGVPATHMVK